jgi:hypothetical protein
MSEHHHHLRPRLRGDAINPTTDAADRTCTHAIDPAIIIGLALGHVRQGGQGDQGRPSVPGPVMARLDMLADRGDPACRMVRNWIRGRRTGLRSQVSCPTRHRSSDHPAAAEINSGTIAGEVL